ncbi:MAG: hypothetical protein CME88_14650 [Hirschia sp.]|nr:hypothetical protein [Hirschia sp.]MBF19614.1 hypothetical protein [Hirschia sp.]|tara:strand:- start:21 stop:395 length:375 start_codon:yes stop_codon:yes gene_type:complete
MTLTASLVMDVFLAILLIIAIAYFWRLDGRLKALRSGKDGMLEAAKELNQTVAHAENAISGLRRSAGEVGETLQGQIDQARALAESAEKRNANRSASSSSSARSSYLDDEPAPSAGGLRRRMNY